ncbi:MAG: hypothetical protein ABSE27_04485 [Acidobacteriaceae bacterium]
MIDDTEHISSEILELKGKVERIPTLLKGHFLLEQINRDLRDLHSAVLTARFAKEGESGNVPKKEVDHGSRKVMPYYRRRWYLPGKEAENERQSALKNLSYIADGIEHFAWLLSEKALDADSEDVFDLIHYIRDFQLDVRDRIRGAIDKSLNELAFCVRSIEVALHETTEYIGGKYRLSGDEYVSPPDWRDSLG